MSSSDVETFRHRFDQVRRAQAKAGFSASRSKPVHQEAQAFAQERGWEWGVELIEAFRLIVRATHAALPIVDDLQVPEPFDGYIPYGMANAYVELGDMETSTLGSKLRSTLLAIRLPAKLGSIWPTPIAFSASSTRRWP